MYTSTLLAFALAVTLATAIPIPLKFDFDHEPPEVDPAHVERLERAMNDANAQILNMQTTLADPTNHVNAQRIHNAFGPNPNLKEIRDTVDRLQHDDLKVASTDPKLLDKEKGRPGLAKVSLNRKPDGSFQSMGKAKIGSRFHQDSFSDKQRAGTLIHEATHQQSRTGDNVLRKQPIPDGPRTYEIVRAGDDGGTLPTGTTAHKKAGYARLDTAEINSAGDLSSNYRALRDRAPNMHQNADSYRVFGALCSRSLYKRALSQEDPVGYYLARRSRCTLPPDYFAKKAAAKAAGAKSTVGPSKSPTTKGARLSTAKGTNSKIVTAKTANSKGLMTQKAGKGSKASTGAKAVKGARKVTKGIGTKAVRNPLTKAAKGVKGAKVAKGTNSLKGVKATKVTKGLKAVKGANGMKVTKATKASKAVLGAKSLKGAKGVKATKAVKGVKAATGSKTVKPTKASKVVKASKATPGKSSNAQKAGKSTTSSKVSSKSSTKASPERSVKVTKPVAQGAVTSPKKKGGKKVRRDLDSVLEELD